jgi:hypothetical protein
MIGGIAHSIGVMAVCTMGPFSCSSPPPRLAQLYLTIVGYGCVDTPLRNSACDGGICGGGACNPGTTGAAYEPSTSATFIAEMMPSACAV